MSCDKEPYIGMPIYLDGCTCDDIMDDILGECPGYPDESQCFAGCDFESWPLAMAYVPMQPWEEIYDPAKGLQAGTVFPGLDLPFLGGKKR